MVEGIHAGTGTSRDGTITIPTTGPIRRMDHPLNHVGKEQIKPSTPSRKKQSKLPSHYLDGHIYQLCPLGWCLMLICYGEKYCCLISSWWLVLIWCERKHCWLISAEQSDHVRGVARSQASRRSSQDTADEHKAQSQHSRTHRLSSSLLQ